MNSFTVKGIPTSFVKSNMKFPSDGGSGEARLFVGNKSKFQELNAFFGLDDSDEKHKKITAYTVMFDKNNFLDYMKYVQLEHVFQLFNKYNDASLEEWQKSYNGIKELKDDDFIVNLYTVNDKNRYYVRADEKIFKDYLRSVIVPKISDIIFLKDEVKKIIEIRLSVNYSYTSSPNGEEEQNDSKIDLPTSPKLCAEYIINHIYDLDSLQSLKPVFKVNDTTLRVEAEILQNLGLPRKSLRFFFNLPNSASYTKSDNDGKVRVFDKVYDVPTEQGNYHAKLTTEWQDKPLEDDFDGNSLTALIKVVNEYYSHYLEIVKTENGYCLKIKNKTTKGIIPSTNILLYGVPGCGKSFYVEKNYESKVQEGFTIRVVFHPDYTYSDFVGQLMPVLKEVKNAQDVKEEKLQYDFVPGPFTRILQLAEIHKDQQCLLIIEELNRGNAPAIFGEIFQLLDRNDDGTSKYAIYNREISKELYDNEQQEKPNEPIKLPPNLTIVATMNTSDQNVFTMDTAFQRRWQMKHIPNRFTGESLDEKTINHVAKHLPNSKISWGAFAQTVNKKMHTVNSGFGSTDDKSLGVYFATDNDLDNAKRFAEKVLKYLWDDAFKLGRQVLFSNCSEGLSSVIEAYEEAAGDPLEAVLLPEIYKEMQDAMAKAERKAAEEAQNEQSGEEPADDADNELAQKPAGEE